VRTIPAKDLPSRSSATTITVCDPVGEHALDASRSQRIALLVEGLVIGAHPQKSAQSLRMGHYFSDGLWRLVLQRQIVMVTPACLP
jgi:hypothetical protein